MSGVVVGKDNWLFLSGGSNNADLLYKDRNRFSAAARMGWHKILRARRLMTEQFGGRYAHIVAPEKISIYPEHYPELLPFFGHHPCGSLSGLEEPEFASSLINPAYALMQRKLLADVYARTDSHWNLEGAITCVNMAMAMLGQDRRLDIDRLQRVTQRFVGDLANKLPDRASEQRVVAMLGPNIRIAEQNRIVDHNRRLSPGQPAIHVGAAITMVNTGADAIPQRVLIFGDSYSGYDQGGLTHLFAELFQEVRFVWSQNLDIELVRNSAPDILLTESAERFMIRVPDDRFDLAAHVQARLDETVHENGDVVSA